MSKSGKIISTNISIQTGTAKKPVAQIELNEHGVIGDAHAGFKNRNVSLLAFEKIQQFNQKTKMNIQPGEFAENLTVSGIDLGKLKINDKLKINQTILQVTQIGKECHGEGCKIFQQVGECIMPATGIFCRVLQGGIATAGDEVRLI